MSVGLVGGVAGASTTSTPSASGLQGLTSDDFLKIMLNQLSHQDPLQPQDSSQLLQQFSDLRNIQSQLDLQGSLKSLISQEQLGSSGQLIGKLVSGLDSQNNQVQGLVTSIRVADGQVNLELDTGKTLPLTRVTQIGTKPAV